MERNFGLFRGLTPVDQTELLGHVRVFLDEKHFEGCGGLEMTDEIRVTIAAQACMLLLHQEASHCYPDLRTILVYPHAYVAQRQEVLPGGIVVEGPSARLGESWVRGVVVVSWDDVRAGAADVVDGHNVTLHEFAHQLDTEDGRADGVPFLERRSQYVTWGRIMRDEFEKLRSASELGGRTAIDSYGATNPAEFFAVITEAFFERPRALHGKHPELYDQLKTFYRQDPLTYGHDGEREPAESPAGQL